MSSSSSSSFLSGSNSASSELPLIPCKICNGAVKSFFSKQLESKRRRFYRCMAKKADGRSCDFFHWEGSYAILLIKDGIISDPPHVTQLLMIALNDYEQAIDSLTKSIRETKENLERAALELMKTELLAAMDQHKQSTATALELMKTELLATVDQHVESTADSLGLMKNELRLMKNEPQKLKITVKPGSVALCVLFALIGWFVVGHMNGADEAFSRLILAP